MASRRARALAALALAAFAAVVSSQSSRNVSTPELNSSILIFGPSDYVANGGQSRCQKMVQNALAIKQSRLMFVPTAFWVDLGYKQLKTVNSQVRTTSPPPLPVQAGIDCSFHRLSNRSNSRRKMVGVKLTQSTTCNVSLFAKSSIIHFQGDSAHSRRPVLGKCLQLEWHACVHAASCLAGQSVVLLPL